MDNSDISNSRNKQTTIAIILIIITLILAFIEIALLHRVKQMYLDVGLTIPLSLLISKYITIALSIINMLVSTYLFISLPKQNESSNTNAITIGFLSLSITILILAYILKTSLIPIYNLTNSL